jgi:Tol biopolymer transport system component
VLEHVASGAFGDVYRAWDPGLDREVALKLLRRSSDLDAHADEAIDEGRLLARVRHSNVVTVYGAARVDGRVGLWMEFLRGRTLAETVAETGALHPARVVQIGLALCDALEAIHRAGLLHRDVKPQNVMLTPDGGVVLMDFGAGREARHAGIDLAGTPLYLAPEVLAGAQPSPSTDVYSLGMLLCFAASGRPTARWQPRSGVAGRLRRVLDRAVDDSSQRFRTAAELARALRRAESRRSQVLLAGACGLSLVAAFALSYLRFVDRQPTASVDDRWQRSWSEAAEIRASLPADLVSTLNWPGPFSPDGTALVARTVTRTEVAIQTVRVATGESIASWVTLPVKGGRVEQLSAAPDGRQAAYSWIDDACKCASIRIVDRAGRIRVLLQTSEIRALDLTEWTPAGLGVLLVREEGPRDVLLVQPETGASRLVLQATRTPTRLSLSRDGRFFAYDQPDPRTPSGPRDVYITDVHRKATVRVTTGNGNWISPSWAPDGTRLVFLDAQPDRTSLYSLSVTSGRVHGSPVRLRRDVGPIETFGFVAPDTLAFWRTGPMDLFVVDADAHGLFSSARARRVGDATAYMPAWSPDGRSLAWSEARSTAGGIRVRHFGSQEHEKLFAWGTGFPVLATWSRDGRRLAYARVNRFDRGIDILDLSTQSARTLAFRGHAFFGTDWTRAEWLQGGREVLVARGDRIQAIDTASEHRRDLVQAASGQVIDAYVHVSPDGRSLLLIERAEEDGPNGSIRVIPLQPGGLSIRMPRQDLGMILGWHPDGRSVLAVRDVNDPQLLVEGELWRLSLSTNTRSSLGLRSASLVYASMAPDGRRLAYQSGTFSREVWLLQQH